MYGLYINTTHNHLLKVGDHWWAEQDKDMYTIHIYRGFSVVRRVAQTRFLPPAKWRHSLPFLILDDDSMRKWETTPHLSDGLPALAQALRHTDTIGVSASLLWDEAGYRTTFIRTLDGATITIERGEG